MAAGRRLEKWKKVQYLHNFLTNFDEIWHGDAPGTSATRRWLRLTVLQNPILRPDAI